MTKIFLCNYHCCPQNTDQLSTIEIERSNFYKFSALKENFLIRHSVLNLILDHGGNMEIMYNPLGKPFLENGPHFNISHSNEIFCIAVSEVDCGVDIEYLEENSEIDDLAESFMHPRELRSYLKLSKEKKLIAFYSCWSRKESIVKAAGCGFKDNPIQIECGFSLIMDNWESALYDGKSYTIYQFMYKQFIISFATLKDKIVPSPELVIDKTYLSC